MIVARDNLAAQNETLELTRSRANSGLTSQADVTRAAAQVATTAATIPPLEASVRHSIHVLSTLIAKEPTALSEELQTDKPLLILLPGSSGRVFRPNCSNAVPTFAAPNGRSPRPLPASAAPPADLLSSNLRAGLAAFGLDSTSTGNLSRLAKPLNFISPTVTWHVFDAGRIISNIALQKAIREETEMQYRDTILTALREVEDGLVGYATEQESIAPPLLKRSNRTRISLALVREQYAHGLANFLDVLDVQRSVLVAEDQLAEADQTVATDLVSLYKSLGGGWEIRK